MQTTGAAIVKFHTKINNFKLIQRSRLESIRTSILLYFFYVYMQAFHEQWQHQDCFSHSDKLIPPHHFPDPVLGCHHRLDDHLRRRLHNDFHHHPHGSERRLLRRLDLHHHARPRLRHRDHHLRRCERHLHRHDRRHRVCHVPLLMMKALRKLRVPHGHHHRHPISRTLIIKSLETLTFIQVFYKISLT